MILFLQFDVSAPYQKDLVVGTLSFSSQGKKSALLRGAFTLPLRVGRGEVRSNLRKGESERL